MQFATDGRMTDVNEAGKGDEQHQQKQQQPQPEAFTCCDFSDALDVMDEKTVLREATWCIFCCCGGCGGGKAARLRLAAKCVCCRQQCESTACGLEDCVSFLCSLACCHTICYVLPKLGSP